MLNYIKAELWKVSRRRAFYGLLGLLLFGAILFSWLFHYGYFSDFVAAVSTTIVTGMLLVPLLAQLVDGGIQDTIKNECSFGFCRKQIYGGKLLSGIVLGTGLCLLLVGGCLGIGWLLLPHGNLEAEKTNLTVLAISLLAALPLWCGMLALCHTLALLIRSTAAWITGYYLMFFMGQPILVLIAAIFFGGRTDSRLFAFLMAALMPYTLLMPGGASGWLNWGHLLWCWGIGVGWLVGSVLLGIILFHRKEVR